MNGTVNISGTHQAWTLNTDSCGVHNPYVSIIAHISTHNATLRRLYTRTPPSHAFSPCVSGMGWCPVK